MNRFLLASPVVAVLLLALACADEGPEVVSPQTPAATAAGTPEERPTTEPTVAATVPPEPTATPTPEPGPAAIPWEEAINHLGEWRTVCGPVPYAHYWSTDRGQPTFVDIGRSYLDPEHFTVVIWGEDRANFPAAPEEAYPGETVCVSGWIEAYREAAQVTIDSPDDIVIQATAAAGAASPQPAASPTPPDFSPFAKNWGRHGFGITVSASGEATAAWRIYKWCSDDPTPPCDATTDNEIISGGRATIIFTRVADETAYGWVRESSDEPTLFGRVALTLQPYDMALLEPIGNELYDYENMLCGPNYWQEAPEWLKEQSPCGA